jgi:hypothetical protein
LAGPKNRVTLVTVVSTTSQLDVLDRGPATCRARDQVVELQEAAFAAVPAVAADERAAPAIPFASADSFRNENVAGATRITRTGRKTAG